MKRIIVGLVLSTSTFMVSAEPRTAENTTFCQAIAILSESVMSARQAGLMMTDAIALADGEDDFANAVMIALVRKAYREPAFRTPYIQRRAIASFVNENYAACLDGTGDIK